MRAATLSGVAGALMLLLTSDYGAVAAEKLTLASGSSGDAAYKAGVGLSSLVKFKLLPAEKIDLQAKETAGPLDNVRQLSAGDADLAIVPSVVSHAAKVGIGSFAGSPPVTGFRAIATLWRDALHLAVRQDDVATGTIDDFLALKDRKVFLGDPATGAIETNTLLLADLGLDLESAFPPAAVTGGDPIAAIKRGDVDAFSAAARPPEASFKEIFKDVSPSLRLLDVTETQMARANGNHWLWTPYVIPAATYPGQNEDVWTIALSNLLVVRSDLDADVVYAITKSIFENLDYLQRIDPLLHDLALDSALAGMAMPLHPGALRYYREAGLIPSATSGGGKPSPGTTPVRQDDRPLERAPAPRLPRQETPAPRSPLPAAHPFSTIAGEWPATGTGGPLLSAKPGSTMEKGREQILPGTSDVPPKASSAKHHKATF